MFAIKRYPGKWTQIKLQRREEVVINRTRIGHTRATHGYIFETEVINSAMPVCHYCNNHLLSIRHVLLECTVLENKRNVLFGSLLRGTDLDIARLIGEEGEVRKVLRFLKEIRFFQMI